MKTKLLIFLTITALGMLSMNSCLKQDANSGGVKPGKVEEMNIPAGFDWKSAANVLCDFSSDKTTRVYVALTQTDEPFATFFVEKNNGADKVEISLPTSVDAVYVSYDTQTGVSKAQKIAVNGSSVTFAVPADSKEFQYDAPMTSAMFAAKALTKASELSPITYPASGWGTLLFEDLWPGYGDYDFNDLVVNYKIQLYPQNKNKVREMLIGIRVNAIGGSLPNELYLKLANVKGGEIDYVERLDGANAPNAELEAINPQEYVKDAALLRFKNIRTRSKFPEAMYVNTEKGFEVPAGELVTATFYVKLRNAVSVRDLKADSFDFFIAYDKEGSKKEIHSGGYEPIVFDDELYYEAQRNSLNTNKCKGFYYSNSNLVWALNVPVSIPHAYENVDFLQVYPDFARWAESGGAMHKDWYNNRVPGTYIKL